MTQYHEEGVRPFVARLKGLAIIIMCNFSVKCPSCQTQAPYLEEMVRYQMIKGLAETDIQDMVLGEETKPMEDTVGYVEGKKSGKQSGRLLAGNTATVNKVSPYQQSKQLITDPTQTSRYPTASRSGMARSPPGRSGKSSEKPTTPSAASASVLDITLQPAGL